MSDQVTFEWETDTDSRDAAALLRDLADGIDAGEIALDDGQRGVTATVPDAVELELEFERAEADVELEAELEWADAGVEVVDHADDETEGADADDEEDAVEADDDEAAELPEVLTADDGPSGSLGTFEVYQDRADEWRWRLRHRNGNIIADSGEGYGRRRGAVNGLRSVQHNAPGADLDVEE